MSTNKGPKVKPRGGEKKLQISKNKALFAKAREKKKRVLQVFTHYCTAPNSKFRKR